MREPGAGFSHGALFYDDLEDFLAGTVPFLRDGITAGEPVLVAVEPDKTSALRAALPNADGAVRYLDMTEVGRNPGRIISAWADFAADHPATARLRGVGEPVWHGRSAEEIAESQRHEALLNLAFADRPGLALMCPYDRTLLEESVLEHARSTHPVLVQHGEQIASTGYDADVAPYAGDLGEPPGDAELLDLAEHALADVRRTVAAAATGAGLDRERADDLVMAVTEAATNSLRHAGGNGSLRLWRRPGHLVCDVRDRGRIHDPLAGRLPVPLDAPSGRGLWLVHQLCDLVQIRSSEAGTTVRMHMRVP